ncbi:tyrosine-type recombinase/integrase [Sphingomonas sp. CFBP 8760]|uniref:tyrosine-type recombinase/integrase n=1 Tax=Sphingomonas sp. CFBP 8760 TaxID=2775282 RepID=UPI00177F5A96|nr:tyrosine-type recombinase/integrase [Sphingomonas sp. CFBP 8760]MBD8548539.1 tyrosine-type recombinase/integrase [Sphingomonas sp. CFBP 8760]
MFAAAKVAHSEFERLIAGGKPVRGEPKPIPVHPVATRAVTNADLAAIVNRYADVTAQPFERLNLRRNVDGRAAAEYARMEYELERDAEGIAASLRCYGDDGDALSLGPQAEAGFVITEQGLNAPEGSLERGAIVGAIRAGIERGYSRISDLSEGKAAPRLGNAKVAAEAPKALMLADVVERYLTARDTSRKLASETRLALRQFESVVGRKDLASITRPDVFNFVEHVANMTVGGKTPGSIFRPISAQSIKKRITMLGSAVNHLKDTVHFEGPNHFAGVKVSALAKKVDPSIMPEKRRFYVEEINRLFEHPWFTGCKSASEPYKPGSHRLRGAEFWVPIVALYTGCRAGELAGLTLSEVRLDDRYPHFIVRPNKYRGVKSGHMREVPILDALIATGFDDYVRRIAKGGHERLFPDWTVSASLAAKDADDPAWSNAKIIRAFNRNVAATALGDKRNENARLETTFHSFRGAFKMMLGKHKVPFMTLNKVIAHSPNELDKRYLSQMSIEETYPDVHGCNYKDIVLPKAP